MIETMRRRRNKHKSTDIYRLINKNLNSNWLACSIFSVVAFVQIVFIANTGMTFLNSIIALFSSLLLIQSVRGIVRLRTLKNNLLSNPESVTLSQVNDAPNIKVLFWLS